MKKVFKFIILFAILVLLSIFILCKTKIIFADPVAQINITTPESKEKLLTLIYNNQELKAKAIDNQTEFYSFKTKEKEILLTLTPKKGSLITLSLNNARDNESVMQYTIFTIDGKKAFSAPQKVDFNTPYDYTFMTRKNKEYQIAIQWETVE